MSSESSSSSVGGSDNTSNSSGPPMSSATPYRSFFEALNEVNMKKIPVRLDGAGLIDFLVDRGVLELNARSAYLGEDQPAVYTWESHNSFGSMVRNYAFFLSDENDRLVASWMGDKWKLARFGADRKSRIVLYEESRQAARIAGKKRSAKRHVGIGDSVYLAQSFEFVESVRDRFLSELNRIHVGDMVWRSSIDTETAFRGAYTADIVAMAEGDHGRRHVVLCEMKTTLNRSNSKAIEQVALFGGGPTDAHAPTRLAIWASECDMSFEQYCNWVDPVFECEACFQCAKLLYETVVTLTPKNIVPQRMRVEISKFSGVLCASTELGDLLNFTAPSGIGHKEAVERLSAIGASGPSDLPYDDYTRRFEEEVSCSKEEAAKRVRELSDPTKMAVREVMKGLASDRMYVSFNDIVVRNRSIPGGEAVLEHKRPFTLPAVPSVSSLIDGGYKTRSARICNDFLQTSTANGETKHSNVVQLVREYAAHCVIAEGVSEDPARAFLALRSGAPILIGNVAFKSRIFTKTGAISARRTTLVTNSVLDLVTANYKEADPRIAEHAEEFKRLQAGGPMARPDARKHMVELRKLMSEQPQGKKGGRISYDDAHMSLVNDALVWLLSPSGFTGSDGAYILEQLNAFRKTSDSAELISPDKGLVERLVSSNLMTQVSCMRKLATMLQPSFTKRGQGDYLVIPLYGRMFAVACPNHRGNVGRSRSVFIVTVTSASTPLDICFSSRDYTIVGERNGLETRVYNAVDISMEECAGILSKSDSVIPTLYESWGRSPEHGGFADRPGAIGEMLILTYLNFTHRLMSSVADWKLFAPSAGSRFNSQPENYLKSSSSHPKDIVQAYVIEAQMELLHSMSLSDPTTPDKNIHSRGALYPHISDLVKGALVVNAGNNVGLPAAAAVFKHIKKVIEVETASRKESKEGRISIWDAYLNGTPSSRKFSRVWIDQGLKECINPDVIISFDTVYNELLSSFTRSTSIVSEDGQLVSNTLEVARQIAHKNRDMTVLSFIMMFYDKAVQAYRVSVAVDKKEEKSSDKRFFEVEPVWARAVFWVLDRMCEIVTTQLRIGKSCLIGVDPVTVNESISRCLAGSRYNTSWTFSVDHSRFGDMMPVVILVPAFREMAAAGMISEQDANIFAALASLTSYRKVLDFSRIDAKYLARLSNQFDPDMASLNSWSGRTTNKISDATVYLETIYDYRIRAIGCGQGKANYLMTLAVVLNILGAKRAIRSAGISSELQFVSYSDDLLVMISANEAKDILLSMSILLAIGEQGARTSNQKKMIVGAPRMSK